MSDHNMTPEVISIMFQQIKDKLDEIHIQTKTTNGRVTALEKWKNISTGVVLVTNIVIIPILLYLLYLHIKP